MQTSEIQAHFPILVEIELLKEIAETGIVKTYASGDEVIRYGQYLKYTPLILSGSIKVLREDDEGKEVFLYFLEQGSTCAMSITCCMKSEQSKIWAIAEEDSKVLMIPIERSDEWMRKYNSWRNFIMMSYASRMEELLQTLDSIAFYSLDERLIKYLNDRSKALESKLLSITHSQIARELNSSREAISRLLKKLENMGRLKLMRNKIEIL